MVDHDARMDASSGARGGAKMPKIKGKPGCLAMIVYAVLGLGALGGLSSILSPQKPGVGQGGNAEAAANQSSGQRWTWRYVTATDAMRGVTTTAASIDSLLAYSDPLGGHARSTTLTLQHRAKRDLVSIDNPNLQFTCSSWDNSALAVQFDDGPVVNYSCSPERTDRYGVAFIDAGPRFIQKLRRAKTVTIEADVFQRGAIQMVFPNPGLTWPPPPSAR